MAGTMPIRSEAAQEALLGRGQTFERLRVRLIGEDQVRATDNVSLNLGEIVSRHPAPGPPLQNLMRTIRRENNPEGV